MKTTTMRIAAIATTAILSLGGAFWAGSASSTEVEYKTKTVTKVDPVEHCITGTLKKFNQTESTIDECMDLNEAQRSEAAKIADQFMDALFSEEMIEESLSY